MAGKLWWPTRGLHAPRKNGRQRRWPTVLSIVVIGLLATEVLILLIPRPAPFVVIEAEAETLAYRVERPLVAGIPLVSAKLRQDDAVEDVMIGLFEPVQATWVRYRWSPDMIAITADAAVAADGTVGSAGTLQTLEGESRQLGPNPRFTLPASLMRGESAAARPLPIAGAASIGQDYGSAEIPSLRDQRIYNLLLGGTIKVFGREALRCTLYFFRCRDHGSLYTVDDNEFSLPIGGRLEDASAETAGVRASAGVSSWYGAVRITEAGFHISATTATTGLRLYRPGETTDAETFGIGLLTRLFEDPSVAPYTLAIVIGTFIFQIVCAIYQLQTGPVDED